MRSVLVGAVDSTQVALRAMGRAGAPPALLVTLPPERRTRHSDYLDLAPHAAALATEVCHAADVNAEATLARIEAAAPDYLFVIGWSQICRAPLLGVARLGAIGFHPAALPRMRGRAVIPWTILEREPRTGSTLFWLDQGVDTGPILAQRLFGVVPDETAGSLYRKHMQALDGLLPEALDLLRSFDPPRIRQDESLATWCARRMPEDGLIDWRAPAEEILLLIRAVGPPYPGAFTSCRGRRLTILAAEPFLDSRRYVGLPGQIQLVRDDRLVIRCGDGLCITATDWRHEGEAPPKLHTRLGTCT
ncbi:MAG: methionyl-tRNA formyltransferase [Geminicoccaceae bacterium]